IGQLDDLHQPIGGILEAQKLAAEASGAASTYFYVQGTSPLRLTLILSRCSHGDKSSVPRNAHNSIMSAITLAGARPVFLSPVRDTNLGIDHGVTTRSVRRASERRPDGAAVLIINPTYYGVCRHLKEIVDLVHEYDIPVLVDE